MKNKERIELIKRLKRKYQDKNSRYSTITKVVRENNLTESEFCYIFFSDDDYISQVVMRR